MANVTYYLPVTLIRFQDATTRTWAIDWGRRAALPVAIHERSATTLAAADVSEKGRRELDLRAEHLHDAEFKLDFYPDGRLKSLNALTTGRLADITGAAAKLVGVATNVAVSVASPASALLKAENFITMPKEPPGTDEDVTSPAECYETWKNAFPDHAERGEKLYATLDAMDTGLQGKAQELVSDGTLGAAKVWTSVQAIRNDLATELTALEEAASAWLEAHQTLPPNVERLLSTDEVDVWQPNGGSMPLVPLPAILDKPPQHTFDCEHDGTKMAIVLSVAGDPAGGTDSDNDPTNDVAVRLPRPAMLGLYILDGEHWVLSAQTQADVVDHHSTLIRIPVDPHGLGNSAASISMNDDGTPESLGVTLTSSLAAVAKAVDAAVTGLEGGASSAASFVGDLQKAQAAAETVRSAPLDQRVQELKQEKKLIDAKISVASAVSTTGLIKQKSLLQAQLDNLLLEQKMKST